MVFARVSCVSRMLGVGRLPNGQGLGLPPDAVPIGGGGRDLGCLFSSWKLSWPPDHSTDVSQGHNASLDENFRQKAA